jgi:hypothetical protein
MLALLLVGVGVSIYWIFKYDDWNPNPIINIDPESRPMDTADEGLEVRAESHPC